MTVDEAEAAPRVEPIEAELNELQQSYVKAANRVAELEAMLQTAASYASKHHALEKEVAAAELQSQVSQLALKAIASVPAKIAAQQLGELEQEANLLLSGSGVSLRFSWARELADKAPLCEQCGHIFKGQRGDRCPSCSCARGRKTAQELELLCDDGSGAEEDVRYNSGGTRALVGSAIRLAASAMLRRLRSTQAAWAIVDEPFGSLDAENREQLARTFAGMLGSVGFEQALVVSHDPALLGALPHRIVVDKDGSSSTLRLE
jgi:DNA repair exonuclease SbcCD ATPase subunit